MSLYDHRVATADELFSRTESNTREARRNSVNGYATLFLGTDLKVEDPQDPQLEGAV